MLVPGYTGKKKIEVSLSPAASLTESAHPRTFPLDRWALWKMGHTRNAERHIKEGLSSSCSYGSIGFTDYF